MGNPLGKSLRESTQDTRHGGTSREGESTHVLGTGCTTSGQAGSREVRKETWGPRQRGRPFRPTVGSNRRLAQAVAPKIPWYRWDQVSPETRPIPSSVVPPARGTAQRPPPEASKRARTASQDCDVHPTGARRVDDTKPRRLHGTSRTPRHSISTARQAGVGPRPVAPVP
ncbi:hypothetical protein BGZ61DRAFT_470509 [Ilyonectria robusta]|uniref:uncharacterized protein n=1 Tax=Ilyonectria robusta TaxID=1079257 RepID=UPI001E8DEB66|nr:uncharacterized protein BGZ61DRAFT_470509 [Ilyonectria robusta]KAH8737014.1 hypothetical protein BGZ61DRAFT_470509 [Ilyonectria robusta]